jgi:hypothetical protein
MEQQNSSTTKTLFRSTEIAWFVLFLLETLFVFRFVFKVIGVNPAAKFTSFIYALSSVFMVPFLSVFPTTVIQESVFEWTILLAMFVYWMIAYAVVRFLDSLVK